MVLKFVIFAKEGNAMKCIENKQDINGYGLQKIRAVDSLSYYTVPIPYSHSKSSNAACVL